MRDVKPAPVPDPKALWCDTHEPQRYTPVEREALSIEKKREALTLNLQGADWCGWKPNG